MCKVSVVMGVYKDRGRLLQTINSVIEQSFSDFEFIIIDDGSPDNTLQTLQELASNDTIIKIIQNTANIGLTKSLFKGVEQANGKYIARIDEGDLWHKDKLKQQVEFLESNANVVIVGTQYECYGENGKIFAGTKLPTTNKGIKNWLIGGKNPYLHSSILFRNNFINYNTSALRSQDLELYYRLYFLGNMHNIDKQLVKFLKEEESISSNNAGEQFYNHLSMHRQFLKNLDIRSDTYIEKGASLTNQKPLLTRLMILYLSKVSYLMPKKKTLFSRVLLNFLAPPILFYGVYKKYISFKFKALNNG